MTSASDHYESHSAETYEKAYFYSPGEYMNYLVNLVSVRLGLDRQRSPKTVRKLLDIGGGTGSFATALIQNIKANDVLITVVEPFLEETNCKAFMKSDNVFFVKEPAQIFLSPPQLDETWRNQDFHQVLMKEVIHHLTNVDRLGILRGLYHQLIPIPECNNDMLPSILIITRPQVDIDYPLWAAAKKIWSENQPSIKDIASDLNEAGFSDIQFTTERYNCEICFSLWQDMIKDRFWSIFSDFTSDELQAGCEELTKERPPDENGIIHFEDRLIFITGRKVDCRSSAKEIELDR